MKNIIIFISGSGTNLQHVIDFHHTKKVNISLVISNNPNAYGLTRASNANIPVLCIPSKSKSRLEHEEEIINGIENMGSIGKIDYILCLGYMRIITKHFLKWCEAKFIPIFNLHPALPGDTQLIGANCIERALEQAKKGTRKFSGVMIHHVIEEVDMGDYISFLRFPVCKYESLVDYKLKVAVYEKYCLDIFFKRVNIFLC